MPSISHNFTLSDQSEVLVSVDFAKNDEVFSYDFQFKTENPLKKTFGEFKSRVENNNIKKLINDNWTEEFNAPKVGLLFLFDLYRANRLKTPALQENLICRCFNVSQENINELIGSSQSIGLREILNKTNATGGCGSCVSDIRELLATAGKEKVRFGGMTASEVLLFIEEKRLGFVEANQVELLGIEGYYLKINDKQYIESFGNYLKDNGISIKLIA